MVSAHLNVRQVRWSLTPSHLGCSIYQSTMATTSLGPSSGIWGKNYIIALTVCTQGPQLSNKRNTVMKLVTRITLTKHPSLCFNVKPQDTNINSLKKSSK